MPFAVFLATSEVSDTPFLLLLMIHCGYAAKCNTQGKFVMIYFICSDLLNPLRSICAIIITIEIAKISGVLQLTIKVFHTGLFLLWPWHRNKWKIWFLKTLMIKSKAWSRDNHDFFIRRRLITSWFIPNYRDSTGACND